MDDFVLSGDGRWMTASKKNGDVEIWNVQSLSLNQTIPHKFPEDIVQRIEEKLLLPYCVGGMTFSPDGSQIALGYADGEIAVWRLGEM